MGKHSLGLIALVFQEFAFVLFEQNIELRYFTHNLLS